MDGNGAAQSTGWWLRHKPILRGLESISCPDIENCIAVGFYDDVTHGQKELIETLSGGQWTASTAPVPTTAGSGTDQNGGLLSIDCPSIGNCTAVGYYETATAGTSGLIDTLSGGQWTAATAKLPSSGRPAQRTTPPCTVWIARRPGTA